MKENEILKNLTCDSVNNNLKSITNRSSLCYEIFMMHQLRHPSLSPSLNIHTHLKWTE